MNRGIFKNIATWLAAWCYWCSGFTNKGKHTGFSQVIRHLYDKCNGYYIWKYCARHYH
jgi:hypothetical protein